jgi:hypothetical protein
MAEGIFLSFRCKEDWAERLLDYSYQLRQTKSEFIRNACGEHIKRLIKSGAIVEPKGATK